MMLKVSSPAKAILFGEHAVVYGKPAIAVALDRRMEVTVRESDKFIADGGSLKRRRHRYIRWAVENMWKGEPLEFRIDSSIPNASGLGSSAALCCSLASSLEYLSNGGKWPLERDIAEKAFDIEYNTQGGASPTDTSASTHGGGILVSFNRVNDHLWTLGKCNRRWEIHDLDIPEMTMVVGFTGKPSLTALQVKKVGEFYGRSTFAVETVDEIGDLVEEAIGALGRGDIVEIGDLMNRNHSLLSILGVNSKHIQKLKDGADRYSYGSKLTGAGGGGSIIAVTDEPEKVSEAIEKRGGKPYRVEISRMGTAPDNSSIGEIDTKNIK